MTMNERRHSGVVIGQKYGNMTVLEMTDDKVYPNGTKQIMYLCQCDCGEKFIARKYRIVNGITSSCQKCAARKRAIPVGVGDRFGSLEVIEVIDFDRLKCKCDCGNEKILFRHSLLNGTHSCGCTNSKYKKIEIGDRFGLLKVIDKAEDHIESNGKIRTQWLCECTCGNIKAVQDRSLKNGSTKSCGCMTGRRRKDSGYRKNPDIKIGDKFGKLTVIGKADDHISPNGSKFKRWLCQCECGNTTIGYGYDLKRGYKKTCGCSKNVIQIGDKFGKLTVIGRDDDYISPNGRKSKKWLCQCECGNVASVLGINLNSGNSKSCGCMCGRKKKEVIEEDEKDIS